MTHINQRVKGGLIEVRCTKCGVVIDVNISNGRKNVDLQITQFEKDHIHAGKEK